MALLESTVLLGPASLVAFVLAATVAAVMFAYRLFTQGYFRCFFSSK